MMPNQMVVSPAVYDEMKRRGVIRSDQRLYLNGSPVPGVVHWTPGDWNEISVIKGGMGATSQVLINGSVTYLDCPSKSSVSRGWPTPLVEELLNSSMSPSQSSLRMRGRRRVSTNASVVQKLSAVRVEWEKSVSTGLYEPGWSTESQAVFLGRSERSSSESVIEAFSEALGALKEPVEALNNGFKQLSVSLTAATEQFRKSMEQAIIHISGVFDPPVPKPSEPRVLKAPTLHPAFKPRRFKK